MLFSEKLIFLMKLTSASNKELASHMQVHPSMISRLRQGKNNSPSSVEYTRSMSEYFAARIVTEYQRSALSETLKERSLKLVSKPEVIADAICTWLQTDLAPQKAPILDELENYPVKNTSSFEKNESSAETPALCKAYFGNAGKREAVSAFFNRLLLLNEPLTLLISTDENLEWITEDQTFSLKLNKALKTVSSSGIKIIRIAPPIVDISEALESFERWLPLYMDGDITSLYYPRLRDNLLHRTLIVAPGVGAVVSNSIGLQSDCEVAVLYEDADIADAFTKEFNSLRAKCVPMVSPYTDDGTGLPLLDFLANFYEFNGSMARVGSFLASNTLPLSLISKICGENAEASSKMTKMCRLFEKRLRAEKVIDVVRLASVEDIAAGKIPLPLSYAFSGELLYYTPAEYKYHLRRILALMEYYENYYLIINDSAETDNSFSVIEDMSCVLFRDTAPYTVFEINEKHLVSAAKDYVSNIVFSTGDEQKARKDTIERLKVMIEKLQ